MNNLLLVTLTLTLSSATSQATCVWADPGANRFTGDPVAAVLSYGDIPPKARAELAEAVGKRTYSEVVEISRSDIGNGRYTNMRGMHWGNGQLCIGEVDRSAWAANRLERGLVYCTDTGWCVIVPTVCGNVAQVTKRGVIARPDQVPGGFKTVFRKTVGVVNSAPEPSSLMLVCIALFAALIANGLKVLLKVVPVQRGAE